MNEVITTCLSCILAAFTLPGTLELLILTLGSLFLKSKGIPTALSISEKPLAIIIPAHNEEKHLISTLTSLKQCHGSYDIIVIADNCSDATAALASKAGVRVEERKDPQRLGKHFALQYAFDILLREKYEYFLIVDADSEVSGNLIYEVRDSFTKGCAAVQVNYNLLNPEASFRTRLMHIAMTGYNRLRPRGRTFLGVSTGILGNGFALSRETLQKVPFIVESIVEDVAYHIELVKKGFKVAYTDKAQVAAPLPSLSQGFITQRSRWEGGRLRLLKDNFLPMFKAIFHGHVFLIEPLGDLLLIPLGYHVMLLIILALISSSILFMFSLGAMGIVGFYTLTAVHLTGCGWRGYLALFLAPFYLLSKLRILSRILQASGKKHPWERTQR